MKLIVMWLWGAAMSTLWWGAILSQSLLIVFTVAASLVTSIAFGIYLYNNWNKE